MAELIRSTRRVKEQHVEGSRSETLEDGSITRSKVFYKESFLGGGYGTYAETEEIFEKGMEVESEEEENQDDDTYKGDELQELQELQVKLSSEDRKRVRERLAHSLIVKLFGRTVGYKYLAFKIEQLWKLQEKPCIVNLGHNYFLMKFQLAEDYNYVLKGGPWFIGGHFLTIKRWEPNLRASEAFFFLSGDLVKAAGAICGIFRYGNT